MYSDKISDTNLNEKVFYKGTNIYKLNKKDETDINHNNTSGYLGVWYDKNNKRYLAYITFRGKRYDLGFYNTASYASRVRQQAQAILYKDYAKVVKDDEFIKNNKYLSRLVESLLGDKEDVE